MMKNTITYTALIIATLLIGIVIGFLANGRFTQRRIERMRESFNEHGFERGFERMARPSPEQMEDLRPILEEFAMKQRQLMDDYKSEQRQLHEGLRKEIDPYLTEEQKERMDRMKKRMGDRFDDEKRPPHGKRRPPR